MDERATQDDRPAPRRDQEFSFDESAGRDAVEAPGSHAGSPANADVDTVACLTLDLENDWYFDEPGYDHLTFEFVDEYVDLVDSLEVPVSFFVVGRTIERFPGVIDQLWSELDCEFHLHSYQHDTSKSYDFRTEIQRGKEAFESHFGAEPIGYRAPQGNIEPNEFEVLESEGFAFDSSIFPSYRPGVYNNVRAPLTPYRPARARALLEIPIGATPWTRVPIALSYLKLLGTPFAKYLEHASLPSTVVCNTHLHDIYRTDSHDRLPRVKRAIYDRNMSRSVELLRWMVELLQSKGYEFVKMTDVYARAETQLQPP